MHFSALTSILAASLAVSATVPLINRSPLATSEVAVRRQHRVAGDLSSMLDARNGVSQSHARDAQLEDVTIPAGGGLAKELTPAEENAINSGNSSYPLKLTRHA